MPHIIADVPHIICEMCGAQSEMLTSSHLLHKHKISLQKYNELFPDAPTITLAKETARRSAVSLKTKGRVAHNKGVSPSVEQREKQSNTMKNKFRTGDIVHWNLGNSLPDDVKTKISTSLAQHEYSDDELEAINAKRRATIQNRVDAGWVSPLKGKKLNGDALIKSQKSIRMAGDVKRMADRARIIEKCNEYNLTILSELKDNRLNIQCNVCKSVFNFHSQIFRNSKTVGSKVCPTCFPRLTGSSGAEKEVVAFLKSAGVSIVENDRSILPHGMELDIWIPDKNIAIEYNGLYWHSESVSNLAKNLENKRKRLAAKGIRLIHIMEDEWIFKPEIVKSRLMQILNIGTKRRIHARKLSITHINSRERDDFLDENHIQGRDIAKIRYGAFDGSDLVAVMTFKPSNFVKGGDGSVLELSRFAVSKGCHIPGIASRLFNSFIKEHNPDRVISYADSRWSTGNLYSTLGFKFIHQSKLNYWYFKPNERVRLHRSNFMKHILVKNGADASSTEFEIMEGLGYYRIYDCGNSLWEWSTESTIQETCNTK